MSKLSDVETMADILAEVHRQRARWGDQDHPDVSDLQAHGLGERVARESAADRAAYWKVENGRRMYLGALSWDGILLEGVYEALAEADPERLRAELLQVAAVAMNWATAICRRARDE